MPDYEQKDNEGVAFKSARKSEDWHADWNGSAMIEGTEYWVNMYDNVSKNGKDYRKFTLKPKNGAGASLAQGAAKFNVPEVKKEDDIPW